MSGTTGKKAPQATPAKTKKRSTRTKVAKTSTRKTRVSATGVKKKAVKKKPVTKKATAKKATARKVPKKAARSKEVAGQQTRTQKPASTASNNKTPEDSKSLSWMSAQAASALKAVKASQAEKGQTILARTRKQAVDEHIDDESLIEIAAGMPVDNDGLIEFATEESVEEQSRQIEAVLSAPEPVEEETSSHPDASVDSAVEAEPEADMTIEVAKTPVEPAQRPEPAIQPPAPPPQPAKRSVLFHPALAASILFSLLLGYYFWSAGDKTTVDENSPTVATKENTVIETPAAAAELEPIEQQVTTAADVATAPAAEPEQQPTESINEKTPAGIPGHGSHQATRKQQLLHHPPLNRKRSQYWHQKTHCPR